MLTMAYGGNKMIRFATVLHLLETPQNSKCLVYIVV